MRGNLDLNDHDAHRRQWQASAGSEERVIEIGKTLTHQPNLIALNNNRFLFEYLLEFSGF